MKEYWTVTKAARNMGYDLQDWITMDQRGKIPEAIELDDGTKLWHGSELIRWYVHEHKVKKN